MTATYTSEELNKFKKLILIDIIQDWCDDNGKRITNLRTATKPKLIDIIIEKNMPKKDDYVSIQDNKEKQKDKYTNPFEVGKYAYRQITDCDGDYITTDLDIEIYRTTKYTISFKITKYGKTTDYKQRKVQYFSTGTAYVNTEKYFSSLTFDNFKK